MNNLDQKMEDDKIAYFQKMDDDKANFFRKIDFENIEDRAKAVAENYDLRRKNLKDYAQLMEFEACFDAFLAHCKKKDLCNHVTFSNQVQVWSLSTGISFFFLMHMSLWMRHRPKRIEAVRLAIKNELAPADGGSGAGGAGSAPSTSIVEPEPLPWEPTP